MYESLRKNIHINQEQSPEKVFQKSVRDGSAASVMR